MIVRCNPGCRLNDGMTSASLDVDSNQAICDECGIEIENVSSYSKLSMKKNGDVLRSKNRKAFVFPCQTCDESVEASIVNGVVAFLILEMRGSCQTLRWKSMKLASFLKILES